MNKFIFDVDGTLTPSREAISKEYKDFFLSFCQDNAVYLVTGSDREKTIEQLGERIYNNAKTVFNCSGNDVWHRATHVYSNPWTLPDVIIDQLKSALEHSDYPEKTGNHIEVRPGAVNFSIVGRNADKQQRKRYVEHDAATSERAALANSFEDNFSHHGCVAQIGGNTGIDIVQKGCDKRQILDMIDFNSSKDRLFFFGDQIRSGGNDYPLATAINNRCVGTVIEVKKWQDTFETLSYFQEARIAQ